VGDRKSICLMLFCWGGFISSCHSQQTFGNNHLTVVKTIAFPHVKGRIDHLDINLKEQIVYVAALGNNSLEIADIKTGQLLHSIGGLDEPQGVGYIPQHDEVFVANGGSGVCEFYNAKTYEKVATIKLSSDADDVRYDSASKKIYVGYGNGGIAIIDADTHKQIGGISLPGHPEGFQLDKAINRLFVNVPDAGIIAVIDLNKQKLIAKWKTEAGANFPMAIDTLNHTLFAGYRNPAMFITINGKTGKTLRSAKAVNDMDDLYYDTRSKELFISGGGGSINIFKQQQNGYKQLAAIATRHGARTSLLIPQLRLFVLAERASGNKDAELLIYKIDDLLP